MTERTARNRSTFGAFHLNRTHLMSGDEPVVPKPRAYDMAEMLREGKTIDQVAEAVGLRPGTVRTRVTQAGWGSDGHPLPAKKVKK